MTNHTPTLPSITSSHGAPAADLAVNAARARSRLRSNVAVAARILPTHYPLRTFIAVNPLDGLRHLPFATAAFRAGELYGARATLSEDAFRAYYAQGRITPDDLDQALTRRYPHLGEATASAASTSTLATFDALRVLQADLLVGAPAPDPVRVYRTRSEQIAPSVADQIDQLSSRWCAAYLTAETTAWPMPEHPGGFYASWRTLAHRDPTLSRSLRSALRAVPERADDAALTALDALGVLEAAHRDYLIAHLTQQPGWPAHIRWHNSHTAPSRILLLDYLAIRLTYEALLLDGRRPPATPATTLPPGTAARPAGLSHRTADVCAALGMARHCDEEHHNVARLLTTLPVQDRTLVWLDAFEHHYRDELLRRLPLRDPAPGVTGSATEPAAESSAARSRSTAQVVCCIDTRSEGLRRHLEGRGDYETLGFAGFFAVAIRYTDLAAGASNDLCPVLIQPSFSVTETPAPGTDLAAQRHLAGLQTMTGAHAAFHNAKDDTVSPFALAEASGWFAGAASAIRTVSPRAGSALARITRRRVVPSASTEVSIETGFSITDRVLYARTALTTMGLIRNFARLVVFCAHGSTTSNNPYQASLDCGACGGQRGGPTARTAAQMLNDPAVRAGLGEQGIDIPDDTWFLAAEHDTASDQITLLDEYLVPAGHRGDLARLREDLTAAGRLLAAERSALLPNTSRRARTNPKQAHRHARTRSADWAQVYPEWGLAGNAAFIIGPRAQTRGIDLHRRAFLHSYQHQDDRDGTVLETILTAPLIVAQWINAQYYFSTVAPHVFGAGSKTIHNVLGGLGVLSGHSGDLQLGLPWQSVAIGDTLVHEPMRLLTVIHAPTQRIDTIVDRNPILQELLHGQWFTFTAPDQLTGTWQQRTTTGWHPWAGLRTKDETPTTTEPDHHQGTPA
jgi:uncharacterized protein YbcC (UPF0753/DUF2309 family)